MIIKKISPIILLLILSCSHIPKEYYFLDTEHIFKIDTMGSIISYSIILPVYSSWNDSINFEISKRGYFLMHYLKNDTSVFSDSVFVVSNSFVKNIEYFDSDWLKNKENLDWFWEKQSYVNGGKDDSVKVYLIQEIQGTDSLKVRKVHRFFMPGREG